MFHPGRSLDFEDRNVDPTRGLTLPIVFVAALMVTLLAVEALPMLLGDQFMPSPASAMLAPLR